MLTELRRIPVVVLVTVHVDRPWQDSVNDALAAAARNRPNVVVADWHAEAESRQGQLVDGVHVDADGARDYARLILAAIRFARS